MRDLGKPRTDERTRARLEAAHELDYETLEELDLQDGVDVLVGILRVGGVLAVIGSALALGVQFSG